MKVLFDLNVVSHMHRLNKLEQLVPPGSNIVPHASLTFLEELSGLYRTDSRSFAEILEWYMSCTWGRLIKRWNTLVIAETEVTRAAVTYRRALEPREMFLRVFNAIRSDERILEKMDEHVRTDKRANATALNQASDWIQSHMKEHGDDPAEIKRTWKRFRNRIPQLIQSCGAERYGSGLDYTALPHFRAFFGCWYVKHYLAMSVNRKHRGSDPYDHGYYVECATLGNFVTADKNLIETISLIPENRINVYNESEWIRRVRSDGRR